MAGHYRHVLKVALAPFIANRAIVGVIEDQAFDDGRAKGHRLRVPCEVLGEVLQSALQGLYGAWRQRTEGVPGRAQLTQHGQLLDVGRLSLAILQSP